MKTGAKTAKISIEMPKRLGHTLFMENTTLQAFRDIAATMQTSLTDWEWVGLDMSQRIFGITKQRATDYASWYGGTAKKTGCAVCGDTHTGGFCEGPE